MEEANSWYIMPAMDEQTNQLKPILGNDQSGRRECQWIVADFDFRFRRLVDRTLFSFLLDLDFIFLLGLIFHFLFILFLYIQLRLRFV